MNQFTSFAQPIRFFGAATLLIAAAAPLVGGAEPGNLPPVMTLVQRPARVLHWPARVLHRPTSHASSGTDLLVRLNDLDPSPGSYRTLGQTGRSVLHRRERAEQIQSRLESLTSQFEARTFGAGSGVTIPYRFFKPESAKPDTKYPLIVYLHGSGGRGTDNLKQISGGNIYGARDWALPENQAKSPCFVLAPQLMEGVFSSREMAVTGEKVTDDASGSSIVGKWQQTIDGPAGPMAAELTLQADGPNLSGSLQIPRRGTLAVESVSFEDGVLKFTTSGRMSLRGEFTVTGRKFSGKFFSVGNSERAAQLRTLIGSLVAEFPIDANRIYIAGQSMGGGGTWGMLAAYPQVFAAAVPVCGPGDPQSAKAITEGGCAIWAFHGDADPTVPVAATRRMIAALRAAGGHPRYTEYPGVKHDSWIDAFTDPALHEWVFLQQRQ